MSVLKIRDDATGEWQSIIAVKGEKGDTGATGYPGKSAYEYAKEAGYAGTEQEFAHDLAADYIPTPTTAQVGQTIVVKEVDEYGKPVSWECKDLPAGGSGGEQWELIRKEMTITEELVSVTFNTDDNGDPFSLKRMRIYMYLPPETDSAAYANYRINGEGSYTSPSGGWSNIRLMGDIETMGDEKTITITWHVLPTAWTAASTQRIRYIWSSSKFNTIRSFNWALFSRNVMPNTTFEIWGVRA